MTFIVFEGIDGCGKTTHAALLSKFLSEKSYRILHTKEPSRGKIGILLREYLKKDAPPLVDALLFTADRAEHIEQEIKPALDEEKIVLCERYFYSTIAYQAAQGLSMEWLKELNSFAVKPDVVILLDLEPEISAARISTNEKFENVEFLKKVRENYLKLAEQENFAVIDASKNKTEVQKEIQKIVLTKL